MFDPIAFDGTKHDLNLCFAKPIFRGYASIDKALIIFRASLVRGIILTYKHVTVSII